MTSFLSVLFGQSSGCTDLVFGQPGFICPVGVVRGVRRARSDGEAELGTGSPCISEAAAVDFWPCHVFLSCLWKLQSHASCHLLLVRSRSLGALTPLVSYVEGPHTVLARLSCVSLVLSELRQGSTCFRNVMLFGRVMSSLKRAVTALLRSASLPGEVREEERRRCAGAASQQVPRTRLRRRLLEGFLERTS